MAFLYKDASENCTCRIGYGTIPQQAEVLKLAEMGESRSQVEWNELVRCPVHRRSASLAEELARKDQKRDRKARRRTAALIGKASKAPRQPDLRREARIAQAISEAMPRIMAELTTPGLSIYASDPAEREAAWAILQGRKNQ